MSRVEGIDTTMESTCSSHSDYLVTLKLQVLVTSSSCWIGYLPHQRLLLRQCSPKMLGMGFATTLAWKGIHQ